MGIKMLVKSTEKTGKSVDSFLFCSKTFTKSKKAENIFASDDPSHIAELVKELDEARSQVRAIKRANILPTFRYAVAEFSDEYGENPTTVLMNYSDFHLLVDAYNDEGELLNKEGKEYHSKVYGYSDDGVLIDTIEVKKSCDSTPGKLHLSLKK